MKADILSQLTERFQDYSFGSNIITKFLYLGMKLRVLHEPTQNFRLNDLLVDSRQINKLSVSPKDKFIKLDETFKLNSYVMTKGQQIYKTEVRSFTVQKNKEKKSQFHKMRRKNNSEHQFSSNQSRKVYTNNIQSTKQFFDESDLIERKVLNKLKHDKNNKLRQQFMNALNIKIPTSINSQNLFQFSKKSHKELESEQLSLEFINILKNNKKKMYKQSDSIYKNKRQTKSLFLNQGAKQQLQGKKLYFDRQPIQNFSQKNKQKYEKLLLSSYQKQYESQLLLLNRQMLKERVYLKTENSQFSTMKSRQNLNSLKDKQLQKIVIDKQLKYKKEIMNRKQNAFQSYLALSKKEKARFKNHSLFFQTFQEQRKKLAEDCQEQDSQQYFLS